MEWLERAAQNYDDPEILRDGDVDRRPREDVERQNE
jgi:hypothetical protein